VWVTSSRPPVIEPSAHPVYETRGEHRTFWWRTPVGTIAVEDDVERERIIARHFGASERR
jgi:hypothetical protein